MGEALEMSCPPRISPRISPAWRNVAAVAHKGNPTEGGLDARTAFLAYYTPSQSSQM